MVFFDEVHGVHDDGNQVALGQQFDASLGEHVTLGDVELFDILHGVADHLDCDISDGVFFWSRVTCTEIEN
jgi:hypothetical protein